MPGVPQFEVLAALLVFRLFYLLIPLCFAIVVVIQFERRRLSEAIHAHHEQQAHPAETPQSIPGEKTGTND
jgi:hypothetical protein